jgi:pilus assembly protein CpaC
MNKRLVTFFVFAMSVVHGQAPGANGKLTVTVGKSLIIDSSVNIRRVSVANGELVEAIAVNPREILINGKSPGETSLVVEQENGNRLLYDLTVRPNPAKLGAAPQQINRDLPVEGQILLKVRFASVDRVAQTDLLSNAFNQTTAISTQQFEPPIIDSNSGGAQTIPSVNQPVNVFLLRPDIDLLTTIKALQARNALEMLAEPNVMAIDGESASFVAGGEFPFPTLQGGAVTVQFREFGMRLNFLPNITPRGTIHLQVAPEVSSLDFAHSVIFQGFNIPALTTRRVLTEVELESGQSFVIGGLLDNSTTENLSKIPGLGDIPLLGKLFQSKTLIKSNTELLVIITPEVVRPIPAGKSVPSLTYQIPFLPPNTATEMHQPGISQTGPVPVKPVSDSVRIEELAQEKVKGQAPQNPAMPQFQLVPVPVPQAVPPPNPGLTAPPVPQAPNSGGAR